MKPTLVLVPAFAALLSALLVGASPIPTSDTLVARSHGASGGMPPPVINESLVDMSVGGVGGAQTPADPVTGVSSGPATQETVSGQTTNGAHPNKGPNHGGTHLHLPETPAYEQHLIDRKTKQLANLRETHKTPDEKTKENMNKLEGEIANHEKKLAQLKKAALAPGSDAPATAGTTNSASGSTTAPGSSV
ncbi:hypothetical protein H0H93_013481 [Arthromyces matolae]|nr:hypothetical protein H0H93_013481 [Arthromyces matolae]